MNSEGKEKAEVFTYLRDSPFKGLNNIMFLLSIINEFYLFRYIN